MLLFQQFFLYSVNSMSHRYDVNCAFRVFRNFIVRSLWRPVWNHIQNIFILQTRCTMIIGGRNDSAVVVTLAYLDTLPVQSPRCSLGSILWNSRSGCSSSCFSTELYACDSDAWFEISLWFLGSFDSRRNKGPTALHWQVGKIVLSSSLEQMWWFDIIGIC